MSDRGALDNNWSPIDGTTTPESLEDRVRDLLMRYSEGATDNVWRHVALNLAVELGAPGFKFVSLPALPTPKAGEHFACDFVIDRAMNTELAPNNHAAAARMVFKLMTLPEKGGGDELKRLRAQFAAAGVRWEDVPRITEAKRGEARSEKGFKTDSFVRRRDYHGPKWLERVLESFPDLPTAAPPSRPCNDKDFEAGAPPLGDDVPDDWSDVFPEMPDDWKPETLPPLVEYHWKKMPDRVRQNRDRLVTQLKEAADRLRQD